MHNSPYQGNSHAADYCMLVPVIDDDGTHRFTVLVKAHQADFGNALPTTYSGSARDVYEEGALIFPCVKVQENYEHIRGPHPHVPRRASASPTSGGATTSRCWARPGSASSALLELGEEIGWDALARFAEQWLDYSEERMAAAIGELPAGRIEGAGSTIPSRRCPTGSRSRSAIDIDPDEAGSRSTCATTPTASPFGLNLTEATSLQRRAARRLQRIDHTVPQNAGSVPAGAVLLRENCVVGIPRHPASCSVATTNLADRVGNAVQRTSPSSPRASAWPRSACSFPASVAVISGTTRAADDAPFINQLVLACTGGAASPQADGWLTACSIGDARRDAWRQRRARRAALPDQDRAPGADPRHRGGRPHPRHARGDARVSGRSAPSSR